MDLPKKKFHLESGLNQRDRATGGFCGNYTHRKPGKVFYCRGFFRNFLHQKKTARTRHTAHFITPGGARACQSPIADECKCMASALFARAYTAFAGRMQAGTTTKNAQHKAGL